MKLCVVAACAWIAVLAAVASGAAAEDCASFDRLPQPAQDRVRDVVDHAVFARAVHGITFRSRERLFLYFLDHLDVAGAAARALKAANYQIRQRSDGTYWGDDTRGAKGTIEVVCTNPGQRVVLTQGTYDNGWFPTIHARIVLVLDFTHRSEANGDTYVIADITGYLRVDNRFLDVLARLVGPIVVGAVDRKVARTTGVAAKVSERAYDDPAGFLEALLALPDFDRSHLAALAACLRRPDANRPEAALR